MENLSIIEQVVLPKISFNFDELTEKAKKKAAEVTSVAITNDTYLAAKRDAKELGGLIKEIDEKRKQVKRQMEGPVKEFEQKCKDLEKILMDAKDAIEAETSKYDDKRRADKKAKIELYLKKASAVLRPEYASRIVMKDSFYDLSRTLKEGREDIDSQVESLLLEQGLYDSTLAAATTYVTVANEGLEQKIDEERTLRAVSGVVSRFINEDISSNIYQDAADAVVQELRTVADEIRAREDAIRKKAEEAALAKIKKEQEEASVTPSVDSTLIQTPVLNEDRLADAIDHSEDTGVNPFGSKVVQFTQAPAAKEDPYGIVKSPFEEKKPCSVPAEPMWEMHVVLTGAYSNMKEVGKLLQQLCSVNDVQYHVDKERSRRITA